MPASAGRYPLVVSRKGRIIAGHTRYEAALSLGLAELPVIVADDLSKAQQRAYRIADNKLAEATSWDEVCWPASSPLWSAWRSTPP